MSIEGDTRRRRCARRARHVAIDLDGDAKDRAQKGRGRVMSPKRKPYQTPVTGSTLLPVSTGKDLL